MPGCRCRTAIGLLRADPESSKLERYVVLACGRQRREGQATAPYRLVPKSPIAGHTTRPASPRRLVLFAAYSRLVPQRWVDITPGLHEHFRRVTKIRVR